MPPERKAAVVKAKKEAPPAKKTKSKKVKETTENSIAGNVKMEPKEARLLQHVNLYNFGENREDIYWLHYVSYTKGEEWKYHVLHSDYMNA